MAGVCTHDLQITSLTLLPTELLWPVMKGGLVKRVRSKCVSPAWGRNPQVGEAKAQAAGGAPAIGTSGAQPRIYIMDRISRVITGVMYSSNLP